MRGRGVVRADIRVRNAQRGCTRPLNRLRGPIAPQNALLALYGPPDEPDLGFLVTNPTLEAFFGRFKLLIRAIITSVMDGAREGSICEISGSS
jgi:hypothetical protein